MSGISPMGEGTIRTELHPLSSVSYWISCLQNPWFGRIMGRQLFSHAWASSRLAPRCLIRKAMHKAAERLTPALQCTSVRPSFSAATWTLSATQSKWSLRGDCGESDTGMWMYSSTPGGQLLLDSLTLMMQVILLTLSWDKSLADLLLLRYRWSVTRHSPERPAGRERFIKRTKTTRWCKSFYFKKFRMSPQHHYYRCSLPFCHLLPVLTTNGNELYGAVPPPCGRSLYGTQTNWGHFLSFGFSFFIYLIMF